MSDQNLNMYGYASDEVKVVPFNFGLIAGQTFLKKFEWIPNGGKDGAEGEALEIVFDIMGTEKGYRKFPVTKAFLKNGGETTDRNSTEFKEAVQTLNACITHILHCFATSEQLQAAFSRPIPDFKTFCQLAASVLPANFSTVPLDIFMQYQWKLREGQARTYLEIPNSMKSGKWLIPAVKAVGQWKELRKTDFSDNDQNALVYVDDANNIHPFKRYGKYMRSNSAIQQVSETAAAQEAAAQNIAQAPTTATTAAPASNAAAGSTASGW